VWQFDVSLESFDVLVWSYLQCCTHEELYFFSCNEIYLHSHPKINLKTKN
jgi:hypothetical protein